MPEEEKKEAGKEAGKKEGEFQSRYTKGQRLAAVIGAVLLLALYIITFISAITTSPAAPELFKACIGSSILIPLLLWCYIRFAKLFMK